MNLGSLFLVVLLLSTATAEANSLTDKIYQDLAGSLACIRRLNETHQVGCGGGGGEKAAYGIIKLVSEDPGRQESDLQAIMGDSSEPTVAVISAVQMANISLMMTLKNCCPAGHLKGILVLESKRPAAFSADRACPNEYSSLYESDPKLGHCRSQVAWNLPGNVTTTFKYSQAPTQGLAFEDFPFPIILLRNKSQVELTLKTIAKHSKGGYPKLAAQLSAQMFAAVNSVSCLRRSAHLADFQLSDTFCSPLAGRNLFYHTINLTTTPAIAPRSVVVLAARQDSFSLFDTAAPGADSAVSSLVVALAISEMLTQSWEVRLYMANSQRHFLLALFDGEAFDYLGSSETAYRMLQGRFSMAKPSRTTDDLLANLPSLQLAHISHFIELSQLLPYGSQGGQPHQLFLHKNVNSSGAIQELVSMIAHQAAVLPDLKVSQVADGHPLPPSSAQSFLKAAAAAGSKQDNGTSSSPLDVLVVTNHRERYLNRHYNSYLEDGNLQSGVARREVLVGRLASIATLFGRVIFQLVTAKETIPQHYQAALQASLKANETLVRGLLNCYLSDSNCDLFRAAVRMKEPQINGSLPPLSTYVSVIDARNELRRFTLQVLRRLTGSRMAGVHNASQCRQLKEANKDVQFSYQWIAGDQLSGECLRSRAYNVTTVSPAYDPATGLAIAARLAEGHRLWTESRWALVSARLFLVASRLQAALTLAAGLAMLALSLAVVWHLDRHSDTLFAGDGCGLDDLAGCLLSSTAGGSSSSASSASSSANPSSSNIKVGEGVNPAQPPCQN